MLDNIKKSLWAMTDKLRANVDAAEYKHLVLGLVVESEVTTHPDVHLPQAVDADYSMDCDVSKLRARAALAGYVLRRWSIDCTPDHSLDLASHHFWLRNPQTLYGVQSAVFAPGAREGGALGSL